MVETTESEETLIRAYGLYWVRDSVNWKERKLAGQRMSSKSSVKEVHAWNQRGVYALYADGKLMYTGLADSDVGIGERLYAHHTKPRLAGRWDGFSWFGINGFDESGKIRAVETINTTSKIVIRTLELVLILAAEPMMNRATGKFAGAERINQADVIKQPTNAELMEEIKKLSMVKR